VLTAPTRVSINDLRRRKSRTVFAVGTLALAVAGMGLFALPSLMDRSMTATVAADRLPDLTVDTAPLILGPAQLVQLAAVPNVTAVEPRSVYNGPIYVGARRAFAQVRGIADFGRQNADVVHVTSGTAPTAGEVLTDLQNARHGLLDVHPGETIHVIGADGAVRGLRVSGDGRNLDGGQSVTSDNVIVLYANAPTVASLSGVNGYEQLDFRLTNTDPAAVTHTVTAVRDVLATVPGFKGFTDLPQVRAAGDWPGKSKFLQFTKFFYVIALLALLSSLVLISNTITTLVAEQTSEIGIMKAIGGRRRRVAGVYLKTALLLGLLATAFGVVLGLVLANGLARYFGTNFYAVTTGLGVDWRILLLSVVVGLVAPVLVALPAIRRAVRVPLREALQTSGSVVGNQGAGDRLLGRIQFLPRTAQIGLRNTGRRRRRSISTALVIGFAVGTLLAVLALSTSVADASRAAWEDHGEDVKITAQGPQRFDAAAAHLIRATPGVASIEPMFVTDVGLAGKDAKIWAVVPKTMFHYRIADGRWYTPAEGRSQARVAVVESDIARVTGTHVGDTISVQTPSGSVDFRVIGIASNTQESGTALYVPLTTMHALLTARLPDDNDYWVRTTSHEHAAIDATTTRIQDTLTAHGYPNNSEIVYVRLANEVASSRTITTTLGAVGFLIVAISMAGLASALTTSVLERTREIGILRSIGARARDIRRIFATETIVLAATGWLIAIPLGYLLDHLLVWMVKTVVNITIPFSFPLGNLAIALVGTIFLALLITLAPIRRAVHYRPGDALRYA
jgi:putative ABC transport system permease protein